MTTAGVTEAEFDRLSWHDNYVYGIAFEVGDPEANDWRADLTLALDHIVEWPRDPDGAIRFRIAPARLTFHDVTDLKLGIDWGDSGFQTALHEMSIDHIARVQIADQKICLDRPYYRWAIALNWPGGGEIAFGASGFTQILMAEPILADAQVLTPARRRRILTST